MAAPRVLIAGGGIAGIAAALRLARAGVRVTLLETRKKLGGRATSFVDVRSGQTLDNCQHVAMGCCTNYLDLCQRLGVADRIVWHREQYWLEAGGRESVLRPGLLPAPAHFAGSFLAAAFLSTAEKLAVARAFRAILGADRARETRRPFADWLREQDQPEGAVRKFWTPVVVSACNLTPERAAASSALHVFQEGFLAHADAPAVGLSAVPLLDLYDAAEGVIAQAGGDLRLGSGVERLTATSATLSSGQTLTADAVICALPFERTIAVIDDAARDDRTARLAELEHSPILGVHLEFDRPVLTRPHAVLVDRPTQWLFRKDAPGRRVHAVISAADAWLDLDEDEIARRVRADIVACLPSAAEAALERARVVKEKRATFADTPSAQSVRPSQAPPRPGGIILAGDYTATGWPATMEGATRSGYLAAGAVLGRSPREMLVPPLPVAPLARWLGLRPSPLVPDPARAVGGGSPLAARRAAG